MFQDQRIFHHRIADVTFRTETDVPNLWTPRVAESFRRFEVSIAHYDVHLQFKFIDPATLVLPSLTSVERELLATLLPNPEQRIQRPLLKSPIVREHFLASIDHKEQVRADIYVDNATLYDFARLELSYYYMDRDLEQMLAGSYMHPFFFLRFFPSLSTVLLHSSGIVRNGFTALFFASDEGGKSTAVKLAPNGTILCDDQIALRQENGIVYTHSTPWGPLNSGPQKAPLGGLFFIEKAKRFELVPISFIKSVELLWNEHGPHFRYLPRQYKIHAFDLLTIACQQTPAYIMRFPKHYIDWDAIDVAMAPKVRHT